METNLKPGVNTLPCPCGCGAVTSFYVPTFAENVIDFARSLGSKGVLVITNKPLDELGIARLKIALALVERTKRDPAFFLRAVFEEYGPKELVRELY